MIKIDSTGTQIDFSLTVTKEATDNFRSFIMALLDPITAAVDRLQNKVTSELQDVSNTLQELRDRIDQGGETATPAEIQAVVDRIDAIAAQVDSAV